MSSWEDKEKVKEEYTDKRLGKKYFRNGALPETYQQFVPEIHTNILQLQCWGYGMTGHTRRDCQNGGFPQNQGGLSKVGSEGAQRYSRRETFDQQSVSIS